MEAVPEETTRPPRNRRKYRRFDLDAAATLILIHHGASHPCRLKDISLGGCQLHFDQPLEAGPQARVEILINVAGKTQRLAGVIQWSDGRHAAGVHFVEMSEQRFNRLSEAILEAEAEKHAKGDPMAPGSVEPIALEYGKEEIDVQPPAASATAPVHSAPVTSLHDLINDSQDSTGLPVGRRANPRLDVDTQVTLHMVDLAARLSGRIVDLSLGGCLIYTHKAFPLGIYRRVEVEFRLHGLPFRLAGVTQTLYSKHNIGIRFLDMSDRKREQLSALIGEVMEYESETETASEDKCGPRLTKDNPA